MTKFKSLPGLGILLGVTASTRFAQALPMFAENRSIKTVSGAVLYPDDSDPNLVYYFPGQGTLVNGENGLKRFSLVYWGLNKDATTGRITVEPADAGGLLSFTSQLLPTPSQSLEIAAQQAAGRRVALLPVQKSMVEVSQDGKFGQKFFEEFNLPSHGGQADAFIGLNSSLTGLGARTLMATLKGQESLNVQYCYESMGLSPIFKGDVHLNWKTVHETLKTSFSSGFWLWRK